MTTRINGTKTRRSLTYLVGEDRPSRASLPGYQQGLSCTRSRRSSLVSDVVTLAKNMASHKPHAGDGELELEQTALNFSHYKHEHTKLNPNFVAMTDFDAAVSTHDQHTHTQTHTKERYRWSISPCAHTAPHGPVRATC